MSITKKHILWIDLLKVVAMFGVVSLHAATLVFNQYGKIPMPYWWTANIYDSAARLCVPLFFMISGYFLLEKSEKLSFFIIKRIRKVVIPLVVWSIIFLIWKKIVFGHDINVHSFYIIIIDPVFFHFWFIYALIGVYFFIPVLRIFILNANNNTKYYFVLVWFFAVSIIPQFEKFTGLESQIDFMAISGFVGYFVLGHIIRHLSISKRLFLISNIFIILSYVFTVFSTYFLSTRSGTFNEYFYGYLSPNIIVLSVMFFLSIKYILQDAKFNSKLGVKIIKMVSSASLGIYFIHPIFLHHLNNQNFGFSLNALSGNPIFYIPITTTVTFILSFLVINILQKTPLFKHCVP